MLRRVAVATIILSLLPCPLVAASHSLAAGVEGPDPDGAYLLSYDVHRDAAGVVSLALEIVRTDADGTLVAARDLGSVDLPAGITRRDVAFLPAEGPGRYAVALAVDGERGAPLEFDVDDDAASAQVRFEVPDEPTYLNLTNDSVNANGKVKAPGEALLTRGMLSDANGLADLDALGWTVEQGGAAVLIGTVSPPSNGTSWSFEHRFEVSPFAAGNYTLRLSALRSNVAYANASRTFTIKESAPTFVSGALANVTPDETTTQTALLVLADRNGPLEHALEPRVYRASTRVEGSGFNATLGAPTRLADADGAARFSYPLALRVPERATAGSYRVSIYADGALLGSMPFDVRPLPTLSAVNASSVDGRLRLAVEGSGEGVIVARLTDGNGSTTTVSSALANGTASLSLDPPRRGAPLTWNVSLQARAGGRALAWRTGNWSVPDDAPVLGLAPLHVRPRLPAAWRLDSAWPLEGANVTLGFARWDGAPEPRIAASLADARVRVSAPADLAAGRYTGQLRVAWPNGTTSSATWTFDAGPWVELELGAAAIDGRVATVPLRNAGGIAVSKIVVETEPTATVKLVRNGTTTSPTSVVAQRAVFAASLAPGEDASLRVELPSGPLRSGKHDVALRVLARVEIA